MHIEEHPEHVRVMDRLVAELQLLRLNAGDVSYTQISDRVRDMRQSRGETGSTAFVGRTTSYDAFQPGRHRINPDLIADIEDGVYITDLFGQGVSLVTGDYSRGASGLRIRNGELAGPVAEITIAGTLPEMFRALVAADDLEFLRGIDVPTLRIDGMSVAGQ